jgi:hypothetical protein
MLSCLNINIQYNICQLTFVFIEIYKKNNCMNISYKNTRFYWYWVLFRFEIIPINWWHVLLSYIFFIKSVTAVGAVQFLSNTNVRMTGINTSISIAFDVTVKDLNTLKQICKQKILLLNFEAINHIYTCTSQPIFTAEKNLKSIYSVIIYEYILHTDLNFIVNYFCTSFNHYFLNSKLYFISISSK